MISSRLSKRRSKRLRTSITVGFALILILITFSFVVWVGINFKYRINQLNNNLISNWNYIYDIIGPSVFDSNRNDRRTDPLTPIKYKRLPSPFSSSRINYYKNAYLHERHSYGNYDNEFEILAGYSPIELSSGKLGSDFLSTYIWFEDKNFILDNLSTSTGRDSGDHFWFVYYDHNNKIGSILLSLQNVGLFSKVATNGRIAEVSGFVASKFGYTHNLSRENTVSGSIFRGASANKYVLVFRIMAKNNKSKSRRSIDITKPVGFRYINRNAIDGVPKVLSSFRYVKNKFIPIIHSPDVTTVERLSDVNKSISSIKLINANDENKAYKTLLERSYDFDKNTEHRNYDLLQNFLIMVTNFLYKDNYLKKENELFYDGPSELQRSLALNTTLRITSNINLLVPTFINEIIPAVYLFVFILISIILLYIYIVRRVVNRVVTLANSLVEYKSIPNGEFHDDSITSKDEIGSLAKTLNQLFSEIYDKNTIIEENHKQANERYELHREMTKIYGHDIQTPIAALLFLLEENKEEIKYIKQIQRASETIMQATEFEESLTNRINITSIDLIDFGRAITNGATDFTSSAKDITFNTNHSKILVYADEEYLEDSMDCIINNACDFGSTIIISVRSDKTHGIIEVFNDGDQIDEKDIELIFEYGTSFRVTTADSHHGIGLFSAKRRINAMSGTITAANSDKGVTFIVKLPLVNNK